MLVHERQALEDLTQDALDDGLRKGLLPVVRPVAYLKMLNGSILLA